MGVHRQLEDQRGQVQVQEPLTRTCDRSRNQAQCVDPVLEGAGEEEQLLPGYGGEADGPLLSVHAGPVAVHDVQNAQSTESPAYPHHVPLQPDLLALVLQHLGYLVENLVGRVFVHSHAPAGWCSGTRSIDSRMTCQVTWQITIHV